MTTLLSPHFTLDELVASQTAARLGYDNTPDHRIRTNLAILAERLELVRELLGGRPILISSGYRSPAVNQAIGGSASSAHMTGLAADFTCPGRGDPLDICNALQPYLAELGVDQLIWEYSAWVHLGLTSGDPRRQCLTIDSNGTRYGFAD